MFSSEMEEARIGLVRIGDGDPDSFHRYLHFLYTGTLLHTTDIKAKFLAVADEYQIETLMDLFRP